MSAITEPGQEILERTRQSEHAACIVCGRRGESDGLALRFILNEDGSVEASFDPRQSLQGYDGLLHGGVIASLLDGAMTNCLFARGIAAVTAEMNIRFRHPIELDSPAVVRARIDRSQAPLFVLEAWIQQQGQCRATCRGKFMRKPKAVCNSEAGRNHHR
jgi:uncharacterized protein (TIGR00369 family)